MCYNKAILKAKIKEMKLDKFLSIHGKKMKHLETTFLIDVFFKDFGENGLNLITPEVEIPRNDGSGRAWRIDFVVNTSFAKYAIECDGFNYHAPGMVSRERDNELHEKRNETIRQGFVYIELTRDQIEITPQEAIYQLRRSFIADKELYSIFLKRNTGKIAPHEVQELALKKLFETRQKGNDKALVVLATGLGKTFLSIFDVLQTKSNKVLFIVHVGEILKKTRNSFEEVMPERAKEMGFFMASDKENTQKIVFATIQTLTIDKNLNQFNPDYFDYIILDETHHLAAPSYKKVFKYFKPKFFLGLTATPNRMDQQDILPYYNNNLAFEIGQDEAIKKGFLTNLHYKGFKDDVDYSKIYWNGFRYDTSDLNKTLMIDKRDTAVIKKFKEFAPKLKTIGFCVSTEHADWCADKFNQHGIKAVAIHSNLDYSDEKINIKSRDEIVKKFENNECQIAFVVNIFNEGIDIPDVECILLLRPTESTTILTQQIGRGLRISPGKKEVLVLDFIGNYQTAHKILPTLGIKNTTELKKHKSKELYYYDNDGRVVEFDSEVVEIFRVMASKATKHVRTEVLDKNWIDYAEYLKENTEAGSKMHWKVGNKNDHLDVHIWALDLLNKAGKNNSAREIDKQIREESKKLFPNRTMEGARALFLSKLLGFVTDKPPLEITDVGKMILGEKNANNLEKHKDTITNQLEKFCFWNDIFSLTNRHVKKEERRPINKYFHVYPIFFTYEVLTTLKEEFGYEKMELTKFEFDSFVSLARKHSELKQIVSRIVDYREDKEKLEIKKLLNKKSKMDSRLFKVLRYCKYFKWSPTKITLGEDYYEEIKKKVKQYNKLLQTKKVIRYDDDNPELYRKLLYSSKNFFEYHK